jgi:citrate lyase synthetase
MYLCEANERSTFHVLQLHFIGYVFRNTYTTGKLKHIDIDYEAQCEAKQVGFVTWLVDLCFWIHIIAIYIHTKPHFLSSYGFTVFRKMLCN